MDFYIRFFSSLIVLFVVWVGVVLLQANNKTKMSQWVWDAYEKKSKIAKVGKKLLVVAGSNALFGIDSKMLSKELNMPVVNFGVNAGVLLPYTLYKAKEVIGAGDVVLLPLEYPMYSYDGVPNEQMIDYIFSRDFDAFFSLSLKEQFYMVWNITFKRLYEGYMALGGKSVESGLYGAHNIDNNGDQIHTDLKYKSKAMQKELDKLKANHYGAEFHQDSLSWSYLKDFVSWCERRDVEVIFIPSTLMYFDEYKNDKKERWFYENIANVVRKKGFTYVGEPYNYMYDKSYYLNTDFHLVKEGREMRTKQIILDVKGLLCN